MNSTCAGCGSGFQTRKRKRKYCTHECYCAHRRVKKGIQFPEGEKRCPQCGQVKPFSDFALQRLSPTLGSTYCKVCGAARARAHRLGKEKDKPPSLRVRFLRFDKTGLIAVTCRKCRTMKSLSEMNRTNSYVCKRCVNEHWRQWIALHPEENALALKERNCRQSMGLSLAEYQTIFDRLFAEQEGRCAICQTPFGEARPVSPRVDHDHSTGMLRSLLCSGCNIGLGYFRESQDALVGAAWYLRHHANQPSGVVLKPRRRAR